MVGEGEVEAEVEEGLTLMVGKKRSKPDVWKRLEAVVVEVVG